MRVLGIDPGSRNTGFGVVEAVNEELQPVAYECIRMGNEPLPERLGRIYLGVQDMITQYDPELVAVEQVFVANNAKSALILGQARGSAVCSAVNAEQYTHHILYLFFLRITGTDQGALDLQRAILEYGALRHSLRNRRALPLA